MATPNPKYCTNCVHCQKVDLPPDLSVRHEWEKWLCTVDVKTRNLVTGLPADGLFVRCIPMRKSKQTNEQGTEIHPGGRCGPEAKLFQAA